MTATTPQEATAIARRVIDWDDGKVPRSASNWIHSDTIELAREVMRLNAWADSFSDAQLKERALAEERIREKDAELAAVRGQLRMERFRPMDDNHHNAVMCPYCNPKGLVFTEPPSNRGG